MSKTLEVYISLQKVSCMHEKNSLSIVLSALFSFIHESLILDGEWTLHVIVELTVDKNPILYSE